MNQGRGANCENRIMSSCLPLLYANKEPKILETMSLEELDTFLPFMILCSLGRDVDKSSQEMAIDIIGCPTPAWWPEDVQFKFPLTEQNRYTIMKSLICRCYTFFDCEYILKFSASLAESPPGSLTYVYSDDGKSIMINNADGVMLVKCRKENLHYDDWGNCARRGASNKRFIHRRNKRNLRTYSSSDEETEVSFKNNQPGPSYKRKRAEGEDRPSKRQARRRFQDFPQEDPEPDMIDQEYFLSKFDMIPKNKETVKERVYHKIDHKKRLAHSFSVMSITSQRGQELLMKNKHSFNLESCLDRIERYCNTSDLQEGEANQVCTRSSVQFSAMLKQEERNKQSAGREEEKMDVSNEDVVKTPQDEYYHKYNWPLRTRGPRIVYRGPSIKPCSVALTLLSEENILFWTKRKRSVSTMTPTGWSGSKTSICSCQRIPLIILDDDETLKYKNKSSSTRCTCVPSKRQMSTTLQSFLEVVPINSQPISKARHRNNSETLSHSSGSVASNVSRPGPASTRSVSHSFSRNKEGLGVISYSVQALHQGKQSLNFKRVLHRQPLAVVPSTPVVVDKEAQDICRVSSCLPVHTSSMKINFYRSILDAVKWYTKDDSITETVDILQGSFLEDEIMASGFDRSQENIRPLTELSLPNSSKQPDYFKININNTERDHCFKKSSTSTSKLVTRRGERLYANREPCAFCFQGRDNFCVYEFIRQAKLAGISLKKRQKQLQHIFFKFIQSENQKS
ncbi:uncharacterized protein LOC124368848 isoform X1 [Homalodisca vitripennis]|uniref:uncharacterized protein LOC124368848 isoform X1 n=1 Tax=Homalodisca vitripennis TaxID=197043 RepID=UPI001EEBD249|nr:uncharacterized protein LOC124368848 isoform X1 [Homalodisca vitripennis]XP_046682243.1 uncharacterized protein LOC124368848 isoform X1 [Homalodisca vitripennis]XP_046682245.1 uncharacterized protein LOC124368848 isoform X1 [Homalodisca vitripennis]XP_046682246.1 uncharacterized protein LOC124368848 isoform X1 [Homalodisca vitripennis]XP_046682247.1 uncharacterized protein LOC124368848 isoform X1 [Homalodisca vitripennis]